MDLRKVKNVLMFIGATGEGSLSWGSFSGSSEALSVVKSARLSVENDTVTANTTGT